MMEVWLHGFPVPGRVVPLAQRAEAQGFHGLLLADSQVLVGDPYVELALAAQATERLQLGVAVTNPVTRHPSVTASSILTVHAESGGRAVLGFARGDSALRQIGEQPASVATFEAAVRALQGYLGGARAEGAPAPIAWASSELPKVPLDVAATGPSVIALGATAADRVTFNLGADVERLTWAVGHARAAAEQAGRDPDALDLGAYVDVGCSADHAAAIAMVRGSASIFVQFLAEGVHGGVPVSDEDREVALAVQDAYAEAAHGSSAAPQAALLPDAFIERFALVGTPERLVERIEQLAALGLRRLVAVPASRDVDAEIVAASTALLAAEVLPRV